jgi:hypothetical protein
VEKSSGFFLFKQKIGPVMPPKTVEKKKNPAIQKKPLLQINKSNDAKSIALKIHFTRARARSQLNRENKPQHKTIQPRKIHAVAGKKKTTVVPSESKSSSDEKNEEEKSDDNDDDDDNDDENSDTEDDEEESRRPPTNLLENVFNHKYKFKYLTKGGFASVYKMTLNVPSEASTVLPLESVVKVVDLNQKPEEGISLTTLELFNAETTLKRLNDSGITVFVYKHLTNSGFGMIQMVSKRVHSTVIWSEARNDKKLICFCI